MRFCFLFLMLAISISIAHAEESPTVPGAGSTYADVSIGTSILSETAGADTLVGAFSPGVRGGIRGEYWGVFAMLEGAMWWSPTGVEGETELQSALNIGLGGELLYGQGYVRTSVALGPSILLQGSELDETGDVGFFLEFRAAGLRWALQGPYVLVVDPLSFSLVAPALGGIPLLEIEYRSSVALEYVF